MRSENVYKHSEDITKQKQTKKKRQRKRQTLCLQNLQNVDSFPGIFRCPFNDTAVLLKAHSEKVESSYHLT